RDFSVAFALAGFLFLGAVATSFHVSIVLFAAFFATVAWPILVKWALWRDLAAAPEEWRRDAEAVHLPGARAVAASIGAVLVAADAHARPDAPLEPVRPRSRARRRAEILRHDVSVDDQLVGGARRPRERPSPVRARPPDPVRGARRRQSRPEPRPSLVERRL